jgi:hypothetical protein
MRPIAPICVSFATPSGTKRVRLRTPETDDELAEYVEILTGIRFPRTSCCAEHTPPFQAFADAFFARSAQAIWLASRGFGGKTFMLSTLGYVEQLALGADVSILGGTGEQAKRVHDAQDRLWGHARAPTYLLKDGRRTARETELEWREGGEVTQTSKSTVLMASSASVRGPHPQRLRIDEADEVDLRLLDSALGQTMRNPSKPSVDTQTVFSSTHHYPDGTVTELLKRATEAGFPVYRFCYRCNLKRHNPETGLAEGWLDMADVERKRAEIPAAMWDAEYEVQEPSFEGRAIVTELVDWTFDATLGDYPHRPGHYYELEPPALGGRYTHGADWAQERDMTVILTLRADTMPRRIVAYEAANREPYPQLVDRLNRRQKRYSGKVLHDETGLGRVVKDLLTVPAEGLWLAGRVRNELLSEYIGSIEQGEIKGPLLRHPWHEHRFVKLKDLYGTGHPPDSVIAGALARRAVGRYVTGESVSMTDLASGDDAMPMRSSPYGGERGNQANNPYGAW